MQRPFLLMLLACVAFGSASPAAASPVPGYSAPPIGWTEVRTVTATLHLNSPGDEIEAGQGFQAIGDYEKAIPHYKAAMESSNPDERVTASYLLAQTYLQAGSFDEAIDAFKAFIEANPGSPRKPQAVFLLARAYHFSELWSEAIAEYQNYLQLDGTISSFVYELLGDANAAAQNTEAAIAAYRGGLDGPIDLPMRFHLLEGIAELQRKAGEFGAAAGTYDAILAHAADAKYRAKIAFLAGQSLAAAGQTEESYARYRASVAADAKSHDAYLSLIELVNGAQSVDEFRRGLIDFYNGAYNPAIRAFERYIESAPAGYADEAHYYAGLAHQAIQNYPLAHQKYDYIINHFGKSEKGGEAWISKGKALLEEGKAMEALAVWADFVETDPTNQLAAEALWQTAAYHETTGDYSLAGRSYAALAEKYPNADRAPAALHMAGLYRVRAGEIEAALASWDTLATNYKASSVRPAALYWLSRLQHIRGDQAKSASAHEQLQAEYPGNYYAVRAATFNETKSPKLFGQPDQKALLLTQPTEAERAEAEQWLLSWAPEKPPDGESLSQLPERLAADGRLRRGLLLWELGLTADASAQIRGLRAAVKDAPLDLYRLGVYLHDQHLPRLSVSCLERMLTLAPVEKKRSIPVYIQKLNHPVSYGDLIVAESLNRNLDPLLVLAMIRQESVFDWKAESWVGAQGLMQIMPTTGDYIAQKTGDKEYSRSALGRPYLNVRFGTWYLAQQLAAFDGDIVAALVAYNAGPGRVARWQTPEMAADDDLFLEYMPMSEPRTYVERILDHYIAYRQLYGSH